MHSQNCFLSSYPKIKQSIMNYELNSELYLYVNNTFFDNLLMILSNLHLGFSFLTVKIITKDRYRKKYK